MTTSPLYQLLPPLSTTEYDALEANIKANGVRDPIIVDEEGNILDGHNRFKIEPTAPWHTLSGLSDAEKVAFVYSANLARRHLSPAQKKHCLRQMKKVAAALRTEGKTQQQVAVLLGVSRECVSAWENATNGTSTNTRTPDIDARVKVPVQLRAKVAERVEAGETQEQVAADYKVTRQAISTICTKERKQAEKKAEVAIAAKALGTAKNGIFEGDFRKIGHTVDDNSVNLIFTDPPYGSENVELYRDLGVFAARVLHPGAFCLAYCGQNDLPAILTALTESLEYAWVFCIVHTGGDLRFRKYKLQNGWKPIVGFYKPPLNVWWNWFPDTCSGGKEKSDHKWQQAESEAAHYIDRLSIEEGLVLDPFAGSGTTCVAAKKLKRRWLGFDTDPEAVTTARTKLL